MEVLKDDAGRFVQYKLTAAPFKISRWLLLSSVLYPCLLMLGVHRLNSTFLWLALIFLTALLLYKIQYKVVEETLLVVGSLGVQLTVLYASGRCSTLFVSRSRLRDVLVCEHISMQQVVDYLALVTVGDEDCGASDGVRLVPLFTHIWPRLHVLQTIYRGVHSVLKLHR